jgi:non-haem Fe2+, alpha-ketoglutarate-dependent halogenase
MDERLRYDRDGILFPISVLTAEEVKRYRGACDRLEEQLGGRPRTVETRQMHLHFRWAYELATHSRVIDAVELLLGPNLLIWATELFAKHPGDGISVGWHRDEDYTGIDPALATTAWIALAPSTPESGCLQVVLGSHAHVDAGPTDCGAATAARIELVDSTFRPVDVVLQPGEMSLHNGRLLHGSEANTSDQKRIGFAVRFVTPAAMPSEGRPSVLMARGVDDCGRFQIVSPPDGMDAEHALEQMRHSASSHLDAVLANLRRKRTVARASPGESLR